MAEKGIPKQGTASWQSGPKFLFMQDNTKPQAVPPRWSPVPWIQLFALQTWANQIKHVFFAYTGKRLKSSTHWAQTDRELTIALI